MKNFKEIARINEIADILGITFEGAESLSGTVTTTMKEIKTEFDHPQIKYLIDELCDQKSLSKAIEHDRD